MNPKFNGIVWTGSVLLDVQAPDPAHINPRDIARGLARRYRFGGHTLDDLAPYSVAWHSLFCEMIADQMGLPVWVRLQALLHDAPEFVLGDMVTPVKCLLRDYGPLETNIWNATAARFQVPAEFHPAVHEIDALALEVERFHLVAPGAWSPDPVIPDEWVDVAARWIGFCQDRAAQAGPLAAALFHSRLAALLNARDRDNLEGSLV
jgi:hypothetical protein